MKALFLLEQIEVIELLQDPDQLNPGVGGTSYLVPQLAHRIAQAWKQEGITKSTITLGCWQRKTNLKTYCSMSVANLNCVEEISQCYDVAVATGGALEAIHSGELKINSKRLIAWIHHPFDWRKLSIAKKLKAEIVSVGKMQYLSNALIAGRHHHIENIFCSHQIQVAARHKEVNNPPSSDSKSSVDIGYMGALIPSKGLHLVLENWQSIKESVSNQEKRIRLHVIGGSKLYSYQESDSVLPCDADYGTRLKKLMEENQIWKEEIIFYGVLGADRYPIMASCDFAIVNPEGYGEAFPATILEWLSLGVPTITARRFGLADVANYLPELSISRPTEIGQHASKLLSLSTSEKRHLSLKCINIAQLYSSKQSHIVRQWMLLLEEVYSQATINDASQKRLPPLIMDEYPALPMLQQLAKDWLDMRIIRTKHQIKRLVASIKRRHRRPPTA
jgi:glycosyltransferase involved in cell wall biosynthesis